MTFKDFNLSDKLKESIDGMGFENPTPVQELAIPLILEHKDLIACAQTGTGKTGAFLIPILDKLSVAHHKHIRCLVLVPTRELAKQIEKQTSQYETVEEAVEVALALVKKEGFEKNTDVQENETYTAEISYPIDREHLLTHFEAWQKQAGKFGFHYTPYNFDSKPEQNFFENLLELLKQKPDEVEDIYFTGALTDTKKTDFFIEYRGVDGRMHNYTPDFVIRRHDGKCLIVEIKSERERSDEIDGENGNKAIETHRWVDLNPDKLKYQMIFIKQDAVSYEDFEEARKFI